MWPVSPADLDLQTASMRSDSQRFAVLRICGGEAKGPLLEHAVLQGEADFHNCFVPTASMLFLS